jgi:hypothetical protein
MTDAYPWYALVTGTELQQGNLIMTCPLLRMQADGQVRRDVGNVVLSQSCDLQQGKLDIVQVCPFFPIDRMATEIEFLRSRRGREELRRGNLPGYHPLNRCDLPGQEFDFLVCDFRSLYGIHTEWLKQLVGQQSPRVRLLPPYREHLAQAFARFFMRVGLPVDVPPFQ